MNIRKFVSGSSVILAAWLGATFLNEVPSQRYPKLDKNPSTAKSTADAKKALAAVELKSVALPVSASQ